MSTTRREFLISAAAVTLAGSASGIAAETGPSARFAYVGTYTATGNGEGIYLFDYDAATGEVRNRRLAAKTANPTWIAIHPSKKFLYASNEVNDFTAAGGTPGGSVSAFTIDRTTGSLTPLNVAASGGAGPAYISIDATGRFLFVANYGGGSFAVLPIFEDGHLGVAIDLHRDLGPSGARVATDAPRGSFAISGHDNAHPHMIAADPNNRFVLAVDLGEDRIYSYRFDAQTGKLTAPPIFASVPSGNGPRHFVFHPNKRWLYLLEEESSRLAFFHYDEATGVLTEQQSLSTLPEGFAGTSYSSEIVLSPDGRFLYCAGRLHDAIAIFSIGPDGRLTARGEVSSMGDYPRHAALAPDGRFFFVCTQRSDAITTFRVDRASGALSFTDRYTPVSSPTVLAFL